MCNGKDSSTDNEPLMPKHRDIKANFDDQWTINVTDKHLPVKSCYAEYMHKINSINFVNFMAKVISDNANQLQI